VAKQSAFLGWDPFVVRKTLNYNNLGYRSRDVDTADSNTVDIEFKNVNLASSPKKGGPEWSALIACPRSPGRG
jgi:hypothetical protein